MDRTIDATRARQIFGTLLDEVFYRKDRITIARKGKALAKLIPIDEKERDEIPSSNEIQKRETLLQDLHSLPTISMDEDPTDVLRRLRSQKRLKAGQSYGE
ncbi:MAG: type II toxin-antitoxin system Phd/YefM family antitoxin [Proteobacteria bacterium]|nr:type II toxin-antitoxin system Phd/YefM family antitoxin [Pseudomonadota bacterium]